MDVSSNDHVWGIDFAISLLQDIGIKAKRVGHVVGMIGGFADYKHKLVLSTGEHIELTHYDRVPSGLIRPYLDRAERNARARAWGMAA